MADSPFLPDQPPEATLPDSGASQPGAVPDYAKGDRLSSALKLLALLATITPMGKGIKAGRALLAGGGALALGGASDAYAQKLNRDALPSDPNLVKVAGEGAQAHYGSGGAADPVAAAEDEQLQSLNKQLAPWTKQLELGGRPKPETQGVVDRLNKQINDIITARAKRKSEADTLAEKTRRETSDRTKALENEGSVNKYRMIGGGIGAISGLAVSALARRNLSKAVKGFEGSAEAIGGRLTDKGTPWLEKLGITKPPDIGPGYTKTPGNVLVSKGNVGNDLHAAVNQAYSRGGAPTPFPPLQDLYASANTPGRKAAAEGALTEAKDAFGAEAGRVPPNAPFSSDRGERSWKTLGMKAPSTLDKLAKASPVLEKGIPLGYAAEAVGSGTASYLEDDPEMKGIYKRMANGGAFAAASHLAFRKFGGMAASGLRPSDDAMRKVNSGRERMQNDVQAVGLKDLKDYNQRINEVGTTGLPKPKQAFKPGDLEALGKARDVKAARSDYTTTAHQNDQIVQAYHATKDPVTQVVDRDAFRKALRQALGNRVTHQGHTVKIDDGLVEALLKIWGG